MAGPVCGVEVFGGVWVTWGERENPGSCFCEHVFGILLAGKEPLTVGRKTSRGQSPGNHKPKG